MTQYLGPVHGIKVLDLSILIAGGTASSLLADFGAEVVKVERPGSGDPLRKWGPFYNDVSLWWKVHSRNKKSITLDLAHAAGQSVLKQLAGQADLLIEGFRPGTMERWGLGPEDLRQVNPGLIVLRYSGFGQTGPYQDRPGFGTIAECMSGYIGMTGFPDSPPVLPPVPLADEIAGVFGAMSAMMALYHREVNRELNREVNGRDGLDRDPADARQADTRQDEAGTRGKGQVIDLSLFEPLFRLCIPHVTMYDLLGIIRERVGNDFPDAAPRSLYRTGDQQWLGLSATSQSTWESLARAMGRADLIEDPRFRDNTSRLHHKDVLNQILEEWLGQRTLSQVMEQLVPSGGVVGPVYNARQIFEDPHYRERGDIIEVDDPDLGHASMLGIVPKFSETPGGVEHAGPRLGEHNQEIYREWLGMGDAELGELTRNGIV
jgi:crotonobetainyl-CoA:carnitine CoA-transferase CaiB-like acyl-CoA transferase